MEYTWLVALISAFILGFSKAGFKGLSFIFVPLMAVAFGSKASTGIILPLLMIGDVMAVWYYRKDANWKILLRLFFPMAVGIIVGVIIGDQLPQRAFKQVMAVVIMLSGILLLFLKRINPQNVPQNKTFAYLMGFGAGFCTMMGNLAGAFSSIYFLAIRFKKREFIGTSAWLFFFINIFKVPFHVWVWGTINLESLQFNLWLAPIVLLGFFIGIKIIRLVSDQLFNQYVLFMILLGSILILI